MRMDNQKQLIIHTYDQCVAIDEMRKKCLLSKCSWSQLPRQDLHYKLDKLEKDFLTQKDEQINEKENIRSSEALALLHLKLKKCDFVSSQLLQKLQNFMSEYQRLHRSNCAKTDQIDIVKKQLSKLCKTTTQLNKQLSQQNKQVLKLQSQIKPEFMSQNNMMNKLKLMYG